MKSGFSRWLVCGAGVLVLAASPAQELPRSWGERESRLANEYLSLLVQQPDYGRVVELLWELYEKHGATRLLLENISAQAQSSRHPDVILIQAHLFRKSGDLASAASLYDEVLKLQPDHARGLRARAEVAREQADPALAYSLLQRWVAGLPEADPAKAQAWVELGTLALAAGKPEEAAAAWQKAVDLNPQDVQRIREVAELLLRAGFPDRAGAFYARLAADGEPDKRLSALYDLARIYEHAGDFDKADAALRQGLALLDFRDGRHGEFFQRRVRLHERFGRLDDLRSELEKATRPAPFAEAAWRNLARFCQLTVDLDGELAAMRELVKNVPEVEDYRWELVRLLLDHDGAAEAASLLEERMKGDGSDLPALVFLRCEADLRQGKPAEAADRLRRLIERQGHGAEVEKQVLAFAQSRTLDAVVELILKARVQRDPGKAEAVFELAAYYRARKDVPAAEALLRTFTDSARTPEERQRRLNDAAAFLAAGRDLDSAIILAREAAGKPGAGREEKLRLADLLAEHGDSEEAALLLETAWQLSQTDEERLDVDERLFSVLMGEVKKEVPASQGTAGDFKLPDAFTGRGFASTPVDAVSKVDFPEAITQQVRTLFDQVFSPKKVPPAGKDRGARLQALLLPPMQGGEAMLLRAAWWALRTEHVAEAYQLFVRLQTDPVTGHERALSLEAEKLLLELALLDKNKVLTLRVLRRLIQADPAGRVRYTLRLSEQLMEMEQTSVAALQRQRWNLEIPLPLPVAEATRLLEQAYREITDSDQLLSALTQAYTLQGRLDQASQLWKRAIEKASGGAAVPLLERYAELLLRQQKLEEYVAAHLDIVARETDVKRRRDAFRRFADRLLWPAEGTAEVEPAVVKERLKLVEDALLAQTRRHPFDGFYQEALAMVYERGGDHEKAFRAMKQAYYTAPETPFSLDQLRDAALRVSDLKSATYFQKQIAATAPPAELAAESRRLVELLEQTFQIAEADQVRRRLESRFAQDAAALENLAEHYKSTGQDEAERRVYEQVARVRPWDARSQLRIALKSLRLGEDDAAERVLKEVVARTRDQAHAPAPRSAPHMLPLPLTDVRKPGAPGPVTEITAMLDTAPAVGMEQVNRLRAFLNLQRPEFGELPAETDLVRLRSLEELARLMHRQNRGEDLVAWVQSAESGVGADIEKLWAWYYGQEEDRFRQVLTRLVGSGSTFESRFCYVWLMLRSHGMAEALEWATQAGLQPVLQEERRILLHASVAMLGDLDGFRFARGELAGLGAAHVLTNPAILEITRDLQDKQRYAEALELGESLRRNASSLSDDYAFFLSRIAESAERWDLARDYLKKVVQGRVQPGNYRGTYDPYLWGLSTAARLALSEQEKEETLRAAWKRLQSVPDSPMTRLRRTAVVGLSGAEEKAADELRQFITGDFMGARRMGEPPGLLTPQGSSRHEEPMHLRGLWEETREIQASFVQQGLAGMVQKANDGLAEQWGAVGLSSRSGQEFNEWKLTHLMRQIRESDYPNRLRLIREHLASIDMTQESAVDTLSELGGRLESLGMAREAIEIYRLLPARAPVNSEYAQWLIRASETARETKVGLKFTLQLINAEPPLKPPQPGDELLMEKHAWFLGQDFDIQELRRRGFLPGVTRVRQGRIPPEVPYLRELALLYERMEKPDLALEAWERLHLAFVTNEESGIQTDAESCLHRARLLKKTGRVPAALESLRTVPLTEGGNAVAQQVLLLRAELAAETGGWAEFRELMATAVQQRSMTAIPKLAELLSQHGHATEALNFLTQGERQVQLDSERFALRLEILKLMARDPGWSPARASAQIASLFRARCRERDPLTLYAEWMATEGQGRHAGDWARLLRAEARGGTDRPVAALGLAALAKKLPAAAGNDLLSGWKAAGEGDRLCVELGAEQLLKAGQAGWAWAACEVLQQLPTLRLDGRKLPLMARVAHAQGDRARVSEFFSEVMRRNIPGGSQPVEWATAFEEIGQPDLARELLQGALARLEATQSLQVELNAAWVRFLIRQKEFQSAEAWLMRHHWTVVGESARLCFELYQAWGKLPAMEAELEKFHLAPGVWKESVFLARRAQGLPPPVPASD